MTVRELIAHLQTAPPDAPVYVDSDEFYGPLDQEDVHIAPPMPGTIPGPRGRVTIVAP